MGFLRRVLQVGKKKRGKAIESQTGTFESNFSSDSIRSMSPILPRGELEDRIVGLWRRVWLGLYEIDIEESHYHSDRLKTLYIGAGLHLSKSPHMDVYNLLARRFNRLSPKWDNGVASLKLSGELSVFTLHTIYEVLVAYENEIFHLEQLYSILRQHQLGLNKLQLARSSSGIRVFKNEFNHIARLVSQRLVLCDIRMNVLNDFTRDEIKKSAGSARSRYVYDMAFPERLRGGFSGPSK